MVRSNDLLSYHKVICLHHWHELDNNGLPELWIKAGVADTSRYIPRHTLAVKIGQELCRVNCISLLAGEVPVDIVCALSFSAVLVNVYTVLV